MPVNTEVLQEQGSKIKGALQRKWYKNSQALGHFLEKIKAAEKQGWTLFANGAYNFVFYQMIDGVEYALKLPIFPPTCFDHTGIIQHPDHDNPERNIRIWNEIFSMVYPELDLATAEALKIGEYTCGKFPYLAGDKPTDQQVAEELVNLYLKDKRIILDPCENFFWLNTVQKTVPNDVGLALKRPSSPESESHWAKLFTAFERKVSTDEDKSLDYLSQLETKFGYEKSVLVVKALVYLENALINGKITADKMENQVKQLSKHDFGVAKAWAALYDAKTPFNINMLKIPEDLGISASAGGRYGSRVAPDFFIGLFSPPQRENEPTIPSPSAFPDAGYGGGCCVVS